MTFLAEEEAKMGTDVEDKLFVIQFSLMERVTQANINDNAINENC